MDVDGCTAPAGELDPAILPEPVITMREDHTISRRDIDQDAVKVLYRLVKNDFTAYLVGGGVRDLLLGRKPKDFDISTNARPEEIRALFRNCILIGRRFRLAHIRYGEKIIETSTFRRTPGTVVDPADPDADLFQRDDNHFGTPQEDALRRDFTVNGLFYDIESFSIIDYVGGMEDLAARRIRSIGDPCIRFREDPVRMVRAIRFASRLDFELDPETRDAIVRHADELSKASPARLLEEIVRLFAFQSGEKAVRLLQSTGVLAVILPEVSECMEKDTGDNTLFWRRLAALDRGDTVLPDASPSLIFAVLLLGALKRKLGKDWPSNGFPRLRFDKVHSFLEPLAARLHFPRKMVDRIVHIYLAQHRFTHAGEKRGGIANFVTQDSFHEALAFAEIVHAAEGKPTMDLNHWRDLLAERIYGREDNRCHKGQTQQQQGKPAATEARPVVSDESGGVLLDEPKPTQKLSRSARRRRNKKLRRTRLDSEQRDQTTETAPEARTETPAPLPTEPKTETKDTDETAQKPSRSRPRRSRKKEPEKKDGAQAKSAEKENAKEKAATTTVEVKPEAQAEEFKPLTAASFYLPAPEEKPKKKRSAKAKSAGKAAKKKSDESPAAAAEPSRRDAPLAMDKADEADIPMHWLDEI